MAQQSCNGHNVTQRADTFALEANVAICLKSNSTGLTGKLELAHCDLLLQLGPAFGIERGHARHHFKEQDPNAPPVYILAMPFALDDFWGHVLHGSYEAVCALPIRHVAFC